MPLKVDTKQLERDVAAMLREAPGAAKHGIGKMAEAMLLFFDRNAAVDTGRFRNAWREAGREAGVSDLPPLPLKPSKHAERYQKYFEGQLRSIEKRLAGVEGMIKAWYENKGRKEDDFKRKLMRSRDKLLKRWDTTEQTLRQISEGQSVVVLDIGRYGLASGDFYRRRRKSGSTIYGRGYAQTFGGDGRILAVGGSIQVVLRNLEPHAHFADRHSGRLFSSYKAGLAQQDIAVLSGAYTRRLVKAADSMRAA